MVIHILKENNNKVAILVLIFIFYLFYLISIFIFVIKCANGRVKYLEVSGNRLLSQEKT